MGGGRVGLALADMAPGSVSAGFHRWRMKRGSKCSGCAGEWVLIGGGRMWRCECRVHGVGLCSWGVGWVFVGGWLAVEVQVDRVVAASAWRSQTWHTAALVQGS